MTEFNHRDRRLTHDHFDAYEGSFIFKESLLEPDALWDDDAEASVCGEEDCGGFSGLRQAISVLAHTLREGFEPRSVGEAWLLLRSVRELDRWFDPYESQTVEADGVPRLAICLSGCPLHRVYVVDLPSGWTVALDVEQLDCVPATGAVDRDESVDDEIDPTDLTRAVSAEHSAPRATSEATKMQSDGDHHSMSDLLDVIDLILETADRNSSMLHDRIDPHEYLVVSRRQLEALKTFLQPNQNL